MPQTGSYTAGQLHGLSFAQPRMQISGRWLCVDSQLGQPARWGEAADLVVEALLVDAAHRGLAAAAAVPNCEALAVRLARIAVRDSVYSAHRRVNLRAAAVVARSVRDDIEAGAASITLVAVGHAVRTADRIVDLGAGAGRGLANALIRAPPPRPRHSGPHRCFRRSYRRLRTRGPRRPGRRSYHTHPDGRSPLRCSGRPSRRRRKCSRPHRTPDQASGS